jgi:hypothetical protein
MDRKESAFLAPLCKTPFRLRSSCALLPGLDFWHWHGSLHNLAAKAGGQLFKLRPQPAKCNLNERIKKLLPKFPNNHTDDGSANSSHSDDRSIGFGDYGIGDAK